MRRGEAPESGGCSDASSSHRGSGGGSKASSSRRRVAALLPICFRQQRGRSVRRLCSASAWVGDRGNFRCRRCVWLWVAGGEGSGPLGEEMDGLDWLWREVGRQSWQAPSANYFWWDGAGESDFAWAPAAWLCLRSTRLPSRTRLWWMFSNVFFVFFLCWYII